MTILVRPQINQALALTGSNRGCSSDNGPINGGPIMFGFTAIEYGLLAVFTVIAMTQMIAAL